MESPKELPATAPQSGSRTLVLDLAPIFIQMLFTALFVLGAASASAAPFVLKREGWSFDRSQLVWQPNVDQEQLRREGVLKSVGGWTEYDFEVPADGWHELWIRGITSGWTRTLYIDGKVELWHAVSTPQDDDPAFKGFKEANFWLAKGKHTIRFHRVTWPGDLPDYWELRAADGDPAGSLRVVSVQNVVRAGEKVAVKFQGGAPAATSYELVIRDSEGGASETAAGKLEFPASAKPIEKTAELVFPKQGVFELQARTGGRLLRPADLKAGTFVVVDTQHPTPAATELKTRTIVDIDCAAEPTKGEFWEKDGATRVVKKPFGSYRESSGLGADGDGYWGLDGFSYRIHLPEAQRLYRLRVQYPDDDRRSMGFWVNDGSDARSNSIGTINTGGVETGDQYVLTQKLQTHEAFFYPRGTEDAVVAVVNLVPRMRAAAARITIDIVESGLPAAPLGETRGRQVGFYFEESGRWTKFFGGDKGGISEDLKTLDRWAQWNRYLGFNLMFPTINVYQANHYPSHILDGYFSRPINEVRLGVLTAEKYHASYVPEYNLTGQDWFDSQVMGVDITDPGGSRILKFASPEAASMVIRDRDGKCRYAQEDFLYNALHPKVQEMYLSIIGELADSLADSPGFGGISTRLMFTWQWQGWNALPNLNFGYDDWTVDAFQRDSGLRVPGAADDPGRFRQRYNYLTGPARERWIAWRCDKIFAYHQRMLARIQQARPGVKLYFNWFGLDERTALSSDILSQMLEVGMDPRKYASQSDIVIIPPAETYGRRYSQPDSDAQKVDGQYDDSLTAVGRFAGRAYGIFSDYYEANKNMNWAELGGKPYSAFDSALPTGLNERGMYAQALANSDSAFIMSGGSGWIFGTPPLLQPFFREYRALPALPFTPWEKAQDPVAIWSRPEVEGDFWFYAVNRLPVPVTVHLGLGNVAHVISAAGGDALALVDGKLNFILEPFMVRAFHAPEKGAVSTISVDVPKDLTDRIPPMLAFAKEMAAALADGRLAPELTKADTDDALACFSGAQTAFTNGEFWKARGLLERLAAIRVYYLTGQYPPALWQRSVPPGLPAAGVNLGRPVTVLDGATGRLPLVTDLTYDAAGTLWATSGDRALALDRMGKVVRELPLFAPFDNLVGDYRKATLEPARTVALGVLKAGGGRLLAQTIGGAPMIFDAASGRVIVPRDRAYALPGQPVTLLATDAEGRAIFSCGAPGQKGVYEYGAEGSLQRKLIDSEAHGGAVDAQGKIYLSTGDGIVMLSPEGKELGKLGGPGFGRLAVQAQGRGVLAWQEKTQALHYFSSDEPAKAKWLQPLPGAVALAMNAEGKVAIGFKGAQEGAVARLYTVGASGLVAEPGPGLIGGIGEAETQSLAGITQLKVNQGKLYYTAYGKLMRLTPGSPDRVEVAYDPGFPGDLAQFESFAIAPNGDLYLSSNWNGKSRGINVYLAKQNGVGWARVEPLNKGEPLWKGGASVATDLEVDTEGRLILRLLNPAAKGQDLSIYRWSPDGDSALLADLGAASGDPGYGLHRLADGGLLIAGGTSRKIVCLNKDGSPKWTIERLKSCPPGFTDLRYPFGITNDSKGRIWVTDPARHQLIELNVDGEVHGATGLYGSGENEFNLPAGVAAVKDEAGIEWLYLADAGNRRLLKWRLKK